MQDVMALVIGDRAARVLPHGRQVRSAGEALKVLGAEPWECVVAEGADAVSILRQAQELRPQATRVLIGAHAPQARAHVVLPATLPPEAAISRVRDCHQLLSTLRSPAVSRIIENLDRLPPMPRTYASLLSVVEQPRTTLADIAEVVGRDPPLAAKVLQIVNSALFGSARQIASLSQAVNMLGTDAVLGLTLSAHVLSSASGLPKSAFSLEMFQSYSIRVARLAKQYIPEAGADAFTAGLVHDIGKLVLALRFPDEQSIVEADAAERNIPAYAVEKEAFGTTHAEVGARLLVDWGVPFSIVQAVAMHHKPSPNSVDQPAVLAVHAAQALLGIVSCGDPETELNVEYVRACGAEEHLERWRSLAVAMVPSN